MSASLKPGETASDFANVLVTVFGLVVVLAALWLGDLLTGDPHPDAADRPPPPHAIVEAR